QEILRKEICKFVRENKYSDEAKKFGKELIKLISLEANVDYNTLDFVLKAFNQDKIYNLFDSSFFNSVNPYMDLDVANANPALVLQLQIYFTTKCAVLRFNHPSWSDVKIYWEASKDVVHIALDGFGMIPVVGEIADLTNGVLYLIEGDGLNATLSFAATIPIAGWAATGSKYAVKIVKASTIGTKVRLAWKVLDNGIEFGQRSQLRKVLGLAVGNPSQAHHIIPWAKRTSEVIQQAAKSGNAFHMNEALNGIAVATWRNQPNHNLYNQRVQALFDNLSPNLTPNQAYDQLTTIVDNIRDVITNNPTVHLNDLIF
ncbi:MAG: AHH domain-containing protein, partial [Polaribacter sp.]